MFGRKRSETEDRKMSDAPDDLGIPKKPARNNSGQNAPGQSATGQPPAAPRRRRPGTPGRPARAAQESLRPAEPGPRPAAALSASPRDPGGEVRWRRRAATTPICAS